MKSFLILIISVIAVSNSWSQFYKTVLKEKVLFEEQSFYLNSKTRIGGKSRNYIKIDLPRNTTRWYYVFTTTLNESNGLNEKKTINLGTQVAKFIGQGVISASGAGMMANIGYQIVKPTGAGVCDIYLCDYTGYSQFFEEDILGFYKYERPSHFQEGTKENGKDGTFQIDDARNGTLYLCFKNPSPMEGVNVKIEVVAVVSEEVFVNEWTQEGKQQFYDWCLGRFITQDASTKDICNCLRDRIVEKYTPSLYSNTSTSEKENQLKNTVNECINSTGHLELINKEERIKELLEEINGLSVVKEYDKLAVAHKKLIEMGFANEQIYNSTAWYLLLSKQYEEAKIYLIKGLGKNPNNLYLMGNLANYYLITGKYKEAEDIYMKYKRKKLDNRKRFKLAIKEDLLLFQSLGIYNSDFEAIRKVLKIR